MAGSSCQGMFEECTGMTHAPKLLATTLAKNCYLNMFFNCTGLTTLPDDMLPATTLANSCYKRMFYKCTKLTTLPDDMLPATTLADNCYSYMFYGCSSLNYVKCLATNISAVYCTDNWLDGVSSTGTFVKKSGMNSWPSGASGIPTGWSVQNN